MMKKCQKKRTKGETKESSVHPQLTQEFGTPGNEDQLVVGNCQDEENKEHEDVARGLCYLDHAVVHF